MSTDGGTVVTIQGWNFGNRSNRIDEVTYGVDGAGYTATDCVISAPDTAIECLTLPAVGRDLGWRVRTWRVVEG